MEKLFDKLSSYNLLNNLLPGAVFLLLVNQYGGPIDYGEEIVLSLFLFYFVGLLINRIGSVFVEPVLKKLKIVVFSDYSLFVRASKKDEKIDILSEINNSYRSFISLVFCLLSYQLFIEARTWISWLGSVEVYVLILIMLIVFVISYRKQTAYIKKRVLKINEMLDKGELK